MSSLDLKFFVHYGTFSIAQLRGQEELVGPAVIEIHRLLKNSVTEATGIRAYTAYTTQAASALRLDGFAESLAEHTQRFDDIGDLTVWVQDMHHRVESTEFLPPGEAAGEARIVAARGPSVVARQSSVSMQTP